MADTVVKKSSGRKWILILLAVVVAGLGSTYLIFNIPTAKGAAQAC